jgi:endonuclease I
MKKQLLIFTAFLMLTLSVQAQILIDSTLSGQPLVTKLRTDYTPNQTLGYGNGRDIMYSIIDNDGNNGIHGIYTDFVVYWTPGNDPSSDIYQNGSGLNAEHIFPQSMGAGSEPAKSDMYNLRACRVNVNSDRGNCPFGEIPDANTDRWYREAVLQTNIPGANIDEWSEKESASNCVFEPRESVKGDIARSVFYFFTIYSSANAAFFNGMKVTLLNWHYQDPVDAAELDRNNQIQSYQGNHNPFILDSTLARRAYFPQYVVVSTEEISVAATKETVIYPNPFNDKITFSESVDYVVIMDAKQAVVFQYENKNQPISTVDVTHLPKGVYWIQYAIGDKKGTKMVVKK